MTAGHYHLHVHPISKRQGHSIHAAIAYRHGSREISAAEAAAYRHAQQQGDGLDAYDYRAKIGVQWFGIFAPEHAPAWARDPCSLWAAVDATETRRNARLAQEIILALPHQVGLDDHRAMLEAFVRRHCFLPEGIIADVAIHAPPVHRGGDHRNVHAHILLTDRPITADGFARTKDRRLSAKSFVDSLRAGWTDVHNSHMARLGLPVRIDHRTLVAQRAEALAKADTVAALDLDRIPQIHVGKAVHVRHPRFTVYRDRRDQNRVLLDRNREHARDQKDRIEAAIAKADTAAHHEARSNAIARLTWQPPEPMLGELQTAYGRPTPTTLLGRIKAAAFNSQVEQRALVISRMHGHPWRDDSRRADAPALIDVLRPVVQQTGPGHPMFTVTAKDLAFAFYGLGMMSLTGLRQTLESIRREEDRLFADRAEHIKNRPKLPPRPPPPKLPTPEADRLHRLRQALLVPQGIYRARLGQLQAFERRYRPQRIAGRLLHDGPYRIRARPI